MADLLMRAVYRPLAIRLVTTLTTELCQDAATRHRASPAASCAMGRGLTAGLLLATLTKGDERVTLQFSGDGPLRGLTVDAYGRGEVRGYPTTPQPWAGRSMVGRQRLSGLLGDGVVNVLRDVGLKDRYQGQVPLSNGEIDEDVEAYLRNSEQIPSALGCEVVMGPAGEVLAAGGLLAQVLPGGDEDFIRELQHALRTGALYDALVQGAATPQALLAALLPEVPCEVLDTHPLRFQCLCSPERIEGMLQTLTPLDLDEMVAEGQAEITCNYCNQLYQVPAETLLRIRERISPREKN